jgi:hypothetical protein
MSPSADPDPPEDLPRRLAALLFALQACSQERDELAERVGRMQSSLSWRLTAPLRSLRARFRPRPATTGESALRPVEAGHAGSLADPGQLLRERLGLAPTASFASRLYVDVTELAREDHGAGVQRVVHRILGEWLLDPPGLRIEPVRLAAGGGYVHARAFLARMLGLPAGAAGPDVALSPAAGDRFVGLDLVRDHAELADQALEALSNAGVRIGIVVYDLLPLQRPDWFPAGMHERFAAWIGMAGRRAEVLLCISGTVAEALPAAIAGLAPGAAPRIGTFPLGADLAAWVPPRARLPSRRPGVVRWLMVGTIEPRKGHAQALDAFERLWAGGAPVELVIAGHPGWCVEPLLARLAAHPERGRRLHWLADADDADLLAAYRDSDALLAASHGEGYGLPLVEAATQSLPILARDLPVFREVAGEGADYFAGDDAEALVLAIQAWRARNAAGTLADARHIRAHAWREAARALAEELRRD